MREPVSVPDLVPLRDALGHCATLRDLQQRLEQSRRRLALVQTLLPALLARELQAGSFDETGWTLTVRSNATAAKLRQWLPAIEHTLAQQGLKVNSIRIKIQPVTSGPT